MLFRSLAQRSCLPLALALLVQSLAVTPAYALSGSALTKNAVEGGPTQPEFQQTQTVGADDLVDPFTGNFRYSIPLFEIGGYPINLSYSSDHKMEEEASWVGFGWTLNPGAISRQVQGLPDDFRGDTIIHRGHMRPSVTTGITPGSRLELFGIFGLGAGLNFTYNNYTGYGLSASLSPTLNIMKVLAGETGWDAKKTKETTASTAPGFFKKLYQAGYRGSLSAGINSRAGLSEISFRGGYRRFSAPFSFANGGFTYTPVGELPRLTLGGTFQFNTGVKIFLPDATMVTMQGSKTWQGLSRSSIQQAAYGYLNLDGAEGDKRALLDYNAEKGGLVNEFSHRLPLTYGTPDIFSVSGPLMSGQIEARRTDVGVFRPSHSAYNSLSAQVNSVEVATGNTFHGGVDVNVAHIRDRRGSWSNAVSDDLSFERGDENKETAYLRMVGETGAHLPVDRYIDWAEDEPVHTPVIWGSAGIGIWSRLVARSSTGSERVTAFPATAAPTAREGRATVVSHLTATEAVHLARTERTARYVHLDGSAANFTELDTLTSLGRQDRAAGRRFNHLSELRITGTGGQRFVYGLPVYNLHKEETTFNASGLSELSLSGTTDQENTNDFGTVSYASDPHAATVNNRRGLDQYFDQVITGAHPTAHLLTEVLSPDYVDRTADGPTLDDLGNYVKIGYSPLAASPAPDAGNYAVGWRTPAQPYRAIWQRGNHADDSDKRTGDDKASFVYGRKEVYYVHHMDSKTHRAVFITSERDDARAVDRHGERDEAAPRLRRLDSIKLYTLSELAERGATARPLKTVHFAYEQDAERQISGNLPTAAAGKLTLRSVSFTYADNHRGLENPYVFDYKTHIEHADGNRSKVNYRPFMVDRWGNQRPALAEEELDPLVYPYAVQDSATAARYCDIGNLTHISLPSGAKIEVDYEPDDYAYVQDKRAGRMYRLLGFSEDFMPGSPAADQAVEEMYRQDRGLGIPYLYTYIEVDSIPRRADGSLPSAARLRQLYLEDVEQLYFNAQVSLRGDMPTGRAVPPDERVAGYAHYDTSFIAALPATETTGDVVVLRLRGVDKNNRETGRTSAVHPITYTALEKLRNELPRLLYDNLPADGRMDPVTLLAMLKQVGLGVQNYYRARVRRGAGDARRMNSAGSFVRLAEARYQKFGDGSRVGRITLRDNWAVDATDYIKTYAYTVEEAAAGEVISSGVAANEPMIGKEEMLTVNQEKSVVSNFMAPDESYYSESPIGLHFYPGPRVGYARVTMSMQLAEEDRQSKPGRTEYSFYTARDFPVIARSTLPSRQRLRPPTIATTYASFATDQLVASQGYAIQVNDMHGRMRQTRELGHEGQTISSTVYHYREASTAENAEREGATRILDNLVSAVSYRPDGSTRASQELLGFSTDVWIEMSQDKTAVTGGGAQINPEIAYAFIPLGGVFVLPQVTRAETIKRTAVITKLIRRQGILERVEVTNNGSALSTTNLHWDALTGSPLLTSTENEYGQPIYSQTLPAYWMEQHAGMGPAYLNQNFTLTNTRVEQGAITRTNFNQNTSLTAGDEVWAYLPIFGDRRQRHRFYAVPHPDVNVDSIILLDELGERANTARIGLLSSFFSLKVVRSGRRNLLGAAAAQTTSLRRPARLDGYWPAQNTPDVVLSSSAMEYADTWGGQCDTVTTYSTGTPKDSVPVARPCPDVLAEVNAFSVLIDASSGSQAIQGADWLSRRAELVDCDACMTLFEKYLTEGLIEDYTDYGTCETNGFVINDQVAIDNCNFLANTNAPYLSQTGYFTYANPPVPPGCRRIGQPVDPCNNPGIKNEVATFNVLVNDPNNGNQPVVNGRDWLTQIDDLRNCDACEDLFIKYLNKDIMRSYSQYGQCNNGNFVITNQTAVDDCAFLDDANMPYLRQSGTFPYDPIDPCGNGTAGGSSFGTSSFTVQGAGPSAGSQCRLWGPDYQRNPYLSGRRGNWRVKASYVAEQTDRSASRINPDGLSDSRGNEYGQPLVYRDGTLASYEPFWTEGGQRHGAGHQLTSQVLRYDDHGHELATEDALNIASAAQYGFLEGLPVAVAQNARSTDIGFDGFEDYVYTRGEAPASEPWRRHFGLLGREAAPPDTYDQFLTDRVSHTGRYAAVRPGGSDPLSQTYPVYACDDGVGQCPEERVCPCVSSFAPAGGGDYLFSVWVASAESLEHGFPAGRRAGAWNSATATDASHLMLKVTGNGGGQTLVGPFFPEGPTVEGWQQIHLRYTLPADATELTLELRSPTGAGSGEAFYFDDLRVQPYESEMTTYAYDARTLRLMAQLDDRGYAIFYEYDDEGMLIRQKRETERGIMTITEQHTNLAARAGR